MNKILIVSPTTTHPQNAGNRARIFTLSDMLRKYFEVHFLYIEENAVTPKSLKDYWGLNLHIYNKNTSLPSVSKIKKNGRRFLRKITDIYQKVKYYRYKLMYHKDDIQYNNLIDNYCSDSLLYYVEKLNKELLFDVVIVEYVFLSKVLRAFSQNTLKIIDTHDIFTNRYKIYLEKNQTPEWISLFKEEEAKGLNRADVCIAIQDEEKLKFSKITSSDVIVVGHIQSNNFIEKPKVFNKTLLFVASANPINILSINNFINNILPSVKILHPDVNLFLAGSIFKAKNEIISDDTISFTGEFDDLMIIYKAADIVINPIESGTGIKIKSIEALSYGLPMVSFPEGVIGIDSEKKFNFNHV